MARLTLQNWNLGGLANSKWQGPANSFAEAQNIDLHGEPGVIRVNQKLSTDFVSGDVVDQEVISIVASADGNAYIFGKNGAIWSRTSSGVYTKEVAQINSAMSADYKIIVDAKEYDGYIYYSTFGGYVGQWQLGTAWSTRTEDFVPSSSGGALAPLLVLRDVLWIGRSNQISKIADVAGTHTFSSGALFIPGGKMVESLGSFQNNLIIGAYTRGSTNLLKAGETKIYNWNTVSDSLWNSEDVIPALGVNAFLDFDNSLILSVGTKGELHAYNGLNTERFKRLPGNFLATNEATVPLNSKQIVNSIPFFGIRNDSGTPVTEGVYSIGSYSAGYPSVLNLEHTTDSEVTAMAQVGSDYLFGTQGDAILKLDNTAKHASGFLTTRLINVQRDDWTTMSVKIPYRSLATGTTVSISASVNAGSFGSVASRVDSLKKVIEANINIVEASSVQIKITLNASGNNSPEIEGIIIDYDA